MIFHFTSAHPALLTLPRFDPACSFDGIHAVTMHENQRRHHPEQRVSTYNLADPAAVRIVVARKAQFAKGRKAFEKLLAAAAGSRIVERL